MGRPHLPTGFPSRDDPQRRRPEARYGPLGRVRQRQVLELQKQTTCAGLVGRPARQGQERRRHAHSGGRSVRCPQSAGDESPPSLSLRQHHQRADQSWRLIRQVCVHGEPALVGCLVVAVMCTDCGAHVCRKTRGSCPRFWITDGASLLRRKCPPRVTRTTANVPTRKRGCLGTTTQTTRLATPRTARSVCPCRSMPTQTVQLSPTVRLRCVFFLWLCVCCGCVFFFCGCACACHVPVPVPGIDCVRVCLLGFTC